MRTVNAARYVTPLREGGSLPAIIEADDDGMYVLKFRGAGQGPKALIAELIAGEIARAAGFLVPELVFVNLDPEIAKTEPDPDLASRIVWLDAYITIVDRTPRNANMLMWHRKLWLIDHGAALYFHHSWTGMDQRSKDPFPLIKQHILLPFATTLEAADHAMTAAITPAVINEIVALVPDEWLDNDAHFKTTAEHRQAYVEYLTRRLETPRPFVEEAMRAR